MPKRHIIRMEPNLDLGPIIRAPVSPAVRVNGFIFTSGYVAINAETRKLDPGSIEHKTRLTLESIQRVLETGGSSLEKVVKVFVFLADIDRDFDGMNRVYKKFFQSDYPARRTVQAKLVQNLEVEIDAIAVE